MHVVNIHFMIVAKTLEEFIQARESLEHKDSIGFVPTMGALHQGHISLVEHSTAKCKHTIVSIFVNPTQFNNPQDLATYPRTLEADCALLEANGVDNINFILFSYFDMSVVNMRVRNHVYEFPDLQARNLRQHNQKNGSS